jgi:hypothetical protein
LDQQCLGVDGVDLGEVAGLQRIVGVLQQERPKAGVVVECMQPCPVLGSVR